MNRFVHVSLVVSVALVAACTQMAPSSSNAGWQTLLDGAKGLDANW